MYNKIYNKLTNKRGASILISLIAFIIASVVSISIILAATSGAITIKGNVKATQAKQTLVSAARLIRNETGLCEAVNIPMATYESKMPLYENGSGLWSEYEIVDGSEFDITIFKGTFKKEIEEGIKYINVFDKDYKTNFSLSLNNQDANRVEDVNVEMTMLKGDGVTPKYSLHYVISLASNENQKIYLKMESDYQNVMDLDTIVEIYDIFASRGYLDWRNNWKESERYENGFRIKSTIKSLSDEHKSYTWPINELQIRDGDDYD